MRKTPVEDLDARFEVLARNVAPRLPGPDEDNQDLLFELSEGVPFDELARRYTSGNTGTLMSRLALLFGENHLNLPFAPRSSEALQILKRAFELLED